MLWNFGERFRIPIETITDIAPLSKIQEAFESLDRSPTALKSLIKVGELA